MGRVLIYRNSMDRRHSKQRITIKKISWQEKVGLAIQQVANRQKVDTQTGEGLGHNSRNIIEVKGWMPLKARLLIEILFYMEQKVIWNCV